MIEVIVIIALGIPMSKRSGAVVAANIWGKAKTVSQVIAVALLILGKQLGQWMVLGLVALWVALVLTVVSMVVYVYQNWRVVAEADA